MPRQALDRPRSSSCKKPPIRRKVAVEKNTFVKEKRASSKAKEATKDQVPPPLLAVIPTSAPDSPQSDYGIPQKMMKRKMDKPLKRSAQKLQAWSLDSDADLDAPETRRALSDTTLALPQSKILRPAGAAAILAGTFFSSQACPVLPLLA